MFITKELVELKEQKEEPLDISNAQNMAAHTWLDDVNRIEDKQ